MAVLLFAVALVAGGVDAIAGGGGLMTIPALLFAGLPPAAALATNKLQGTAGSFMAALHFWRAGEIRLSEIRLAALLALAGGVAGGVLVSHLDPALLQKAIPPVLVAVALYVLFSPRISDVDSQARLSLPLYSLTLVPLIGLYDGFLGPGTGSFFALSLVALAGWNLRRATAHAKLLNFCTNVAALAALLAAGHVVWFYGAVMIAGQVLGASIGAHLVLRGGVRLIRPLLVGMSLLMSAVLAAK